VTSEKVFWDTKSERKKGVKDRKRKGWRVERI
jgi:hypothetical protein